jgi:hypothetical protein
LRKAAGDEGGNPGRLQYWTEKFGCTKEQLQAAVDKVGVSAAAVEKALKAK